MTWFSTIELAEMCGKSTRTIKKKCEGLKTRKGAHNAIMYDSTEALPRIFSEGDDYATEKTRLTKAQANHEELRVKEKDGSLIPADAVEEMMMGKVLAARAALLSLPTRIAPLAMSASTIREVEDAARDIVYEALNGLADGLPEDSQKLFEEFSEFRGLMTA